MKVFVYLRPNLHLLSGYHLTFQKKKKKSPLCWKHFVMY